jgi:hypothetical protein
VRWVGWFLAATVVVWSLDRLALWAEDRGWVYWRRRHGTGGSATVLGDVFLLFQPNRAHVVEEQKRQQQTIAYPEDAAPPLDVDLDAGVAHRPGVDAGATPPDAGTAAPAREPTSGDVSDPLDGEDGSSGVRP